MAGRWDQRFFASTRGRIVALLRRASRTVEELAQALGLTDNAIRAHLASLERDGLVRQQGVRRGVRKPSYAYDLTPEADRLFPKPYAPVLGQLLDVLAERLEPAEVEALLRAEGYPVLGFTWYSLTDQLDWDVALRDERHLVNPVGLYDLDRRPRPVAATYRQIICEFGEDAAHTT